MKNKIVIIDYGLGNIKSIYDAFSRFNESVVISKNLKTIGSANSIILPGVGSFAKAMQLINKLGLKNSIINHVKNKTIIPLQQFNTSILSNKLILEIKDNYS